MFKVSICSIQRSGGLTSSFVVSENCNRLLDSSLDVRPFNSEPVTIGSSFLIDIGGDSLSAILVLRFARGESFPYDRRIDAGVAFDVFFLIDKGSIPFTVFDAVFDTFMFFGVMSVFPDGMKGCLRLRGSCDGVSGGKELE